MSIHIENNVQKMVAIVLKKVKYWRVFSIDFWLLLCYNQIVKGDYLVILHKENGSLSTKITNSGLFSKIQKKTAIKIYLAHTKKY